MKSNKINKKELSLKPFAISIVSLVAIIFGLMMIKYMKDVKEYESNNTYSMEKNWSKVHHQWKEPPDELKMYVGDGYYYYNYRYEGKDFFIKANDSEILNSREIYKNYDKRSTPSDLTNEDIILKISGNSSLTIYDYLKTMGTRLK